MNGKGIYFALASLLGLVAVFLEFLPILGVFLVFLSLLYTYKAFRARQIIIVCTLFALFLVIGKCAVTANKTAINAKKTNFQLIFHDWKINGDMIQIIAKDRSTNEKLIIDYRMKSIEEKVQLSKQNLNGKKCFVTGSLEIPSSARNPNSFNYRQYLATKQIYWILSVDHFPLQSCSPANTTFLSLIQQLRYKGINYISSQFSEPTAALAVTLIFGARNTMPTELVTSYQKTGLVHILAISGLHVSLLTGIIFFIGIRIGVVREDMLTGLLTFLPVYALLTGASPSVVRSVVMTMILLGSLKIRWKRFLPIDAVCVACMLMLLCKPFLLFDIGFLLSFTSSSALLLSSSLISRYKYPIMQLFIISFIAQIASLPVLLWNFYEFSLISLPLNVVFVPFFSFLLPVILVLFILPPFLKSVASPIFFIVNDAITLVNNSITWLGQQSFPIVILGRPDWRMLIGFLMVFILFFIKWDELKTLKTFIPLLFLLLAPFFVQGIITKWSPMGEITFIDVSQGDSILVRLPYNQGVYLIDTGGSVPFEKEAWQVKKKEFKVGDDVVIPFLKSKGITTIDKLILTHGDYDHIGGAAAIIEQLHVREVLFPKTVKMSEIEDETMGIAQKANVKINFLSEGLSWRSGDNMFRVLSPVVNQKGEDRNNQSIAIVAQIGGLTWLFPGDLEQEGERSLVSRNPSLSIDVLKVGHHGSKTSTTEELLTTFSPKLAIISVGSQNQYGHPHQEVITKLVNNGTSVLRTDQHGAITYFFKGENGTFSTMLP